jgi:hypothetical protein
VTAKARHVTADAGAPAVIEHEESTESTPLGLEWEEVSGRGDPAQRFRLYRLCEMVPLTGRPMLRVQRGRCSACRGEGRTLELVATCASPEAVGTALVTLGREGEWAECPVGVLDTEGESGEKWIVTPWLPSARNVSDAGRTLRGARK